MNATIIVTPKANVFDPQGDALRRALEGQGLIGVLEAHVGRYIRLEISPAHAAAARKRLPELCRDFLSNPVVEDFQLMVGGGTGPSKAHVIFAAGEEMAGSLVGRQAVEAASGRRGIRKRQPAHSSKKSATPTTRKTRSKPKTKARARR